MSEFLVLRGDDRGQFLAADLAHLVSELSLVLHRDDESLAPPLLALPGERVESVFKLLKSLVRIV